ncbi:nuclease [Neisseria zoodegmatis]|uniref:Nuclease n=1 Tax=Neisseria zoodegmatis TaxID=326523 RepID=A0A378WFY0_9NEIS|nr:thermonuclease family protein [Neisseria zoodegmatis]SUA36320.1 nuclease [Neisseria zoodegmatis]
MKKILTVLIALYSGQALAQNISCTVVGIADGDTLTCLTASKQQIKVRLNQIDAPEKKQAFGNASKKKLSSLVFQKNVLLKTDGTDKYGRTIAEVFSDGQNVNKEMVRSGYAWAYRKYLKDSQYLQLEKQARAASLGLWSEPNPIYPSEFRHGERPKTVTSSVQPKQASPSGRFVCGGKRFCKQMTSCAEAKFYLNQCGVTRLDRDGDGRPCESIC